MTNKELILKNLAIGKHVVVESNDGDYAVFSKFGELYRSSCVYGTKEEAKLTIGCYGISQKNIFCGDYTFIEAFDFEYETFKPGDKVLVSKDAEKWLKKSDLVCYGAKREMFGKIFEVKKLWNDYIDVWNEDKSECWSFSKETLSFAPDPVKKETIKIGDCEYDKEEFEKATKDLKPIK